MATATQAQYAAGIAKAMQLATQLINQKAGLFRDSATQIADQEIPGAVKQIIDAALAAS
jgi:hypothetical protein